MMLASTFTPRSGHSVAHWPDQLVHIKCAMRLQEVGDKLAYVIVRPGGLKSEAPTGTGALTGDAQRLGGWAGKLRALCIV